MVGCTEQEKKPRTNEELAMLVKSGDNEAAAQLWEQTRRLLYGLFYKRYNEHRERTAAAGITQEDLQQEAYFALLEAVQAFSPEKGYRLTTYFGFLVMTRFASLVGLRTPAQRKRPLDNAESMDEALPGAEDITRGEVIPDPSALQMLRGVEDDLYTAQLHSALEVCLASMEAGHAAMLRARYYKQLTAVQIAAATGYELATVRQLEQRAMRAARHPQNMRRLRQYREEIMTVHAYHGTGFNAWKNGGSVEERAIEHLERKGIL